MAENEDGGKIPPRPHPICRDLMCASTSAALSEFFPPQRVAASHP